MPGASAPVPPNPLHAPRDSQGQLLPSSQLKPSNTFSQPLKVQKLLKLSSKALWPGPCRGPQPLPELNTFLTYFAFEYSQIKILSLVHPSLGPQLSPLPD